MTRIRGLFLALLMTGLLVPVPALAQRETSETKKATEHIALALATQDEAEKLGHYRQALAEIEGALVADAENALVWKVAGEAYAGVGRIEEARDAFAKAEQLNPEYVAELETLRETAWIQAFQRSVKYMDMIPPDQPDSPYADSALMILETANQVYDKRPEGYLNIANLYAQKGQIDPAVAALERSIEVSHGPLYEQLDSAGQASWRNLRRIATSNIATLRASAGVQAFQADDFAAAERYFAEARETNPHSRDYLFNMIQAQWRQAQQIEEQITADSAAADQFEPQVRAIYEKIKGELPGLKEMDPNNEQSVIMAANIEKRFAEMRGDSAAAVGQATYAVLKELETMPVGLDQITVQAQSGTAQISGQIRNLNVEQGSQVTIHMTLIGPDGSEVGTTDIQVSAPAPAPPEGGLAPQVPFSGSAPVTGAVVGWRYRVSTG